MGLSEEGQDHKIMFVFDRGTRSFGPFGDLPYCIIPTDRAWLHHHSSLNQPTLNWPDDLVPGLARMGHRTPECEAQLLRTSSLLVEI